MPSWILNSLLAAADALKISGESEHAASLLRLVDDPEVQGLRLFRFPEVADLAETINSCDELEQLFGHLSDICSVFSVAHCTIQRIRECHVGDYGAKILSTYPGAWIEEYISRRFFMVDPVVSRMLEEPGLFFWDELPGGGPIAADFFHAAATHGIGPAGLTYVGDNGHGDTFAVTITVPLSHRAFRPFFEPKLSDFTDIAELLIEVFSDLTCSYPETRTSLTYDQIRLLRVIASGGCPESFGRELGGHTTLASLERSILQALNANNLVQAMAVAVKRGLLDVVPFNQEDIFRPDDQPDLLRSSAA